DADRLEVVADVHPARAGLRQIHREADRQLAHLSGGGVELLQPAAGFVDDRAVVDVHRTHVPDRLVAQTLNPTILRVEAEYVEYLVFAVGDEVQRIAVPAR